MKKYIFALDQGTTSSRSILFDENGAIVSLASKEFKQKFPQNGWVEHNPWDIWATQMWTISETLRRSKVDIREVAAIGITNQRETTVVWDKRNGEPVYPAIVWQCRRTADRIEELKAEGYDKQIQRKTGLIADAYFSATKIEWILDYVPDAREKAEEGNLLFGTIDSWLMWNLSGGKIHKTDMSNASRTMLYDIHKCEWCSEILKKLHIPESMLPQVQPSSSLFGYTDEALLGTTIPITGVAGDQQAALFGQCCFEEGSVKNTYGTGCFLLMHTGDQAVTSQNGLITTMAATIDKKPRYALEGSVFVAGAAIQWMRDELQMIQSARETKDYAESVKDSNGMYIVPAFTGLGAPHWDQYARGSIFGLTRGVTKAHYIRAVLESLAYQSYDMVKAMEGDAGVSLKQLRVDGGASANDFLMQFQADILQKEVVRPEVIETTALGVAYLAGLQIGIWKDIRDIEKKSISNQVFYPQMSQKLANIKLKGWDKAIACTKLWAQQD